MNARTRSGGFTLLEVLIAMLIIGIIATALVPMLGSYSQKAREAREAANLAIIEKALERYGTEHVVAPGYVYDSTTDEIVSFGLIGGEGAALQMLHPTDVNGNVMGSPVSASPGPFSYGPYLAQLPAEPASVLLAAAVNRPAMILSGTTTWVGVSVDNAGGITGVQYFVGVQKRRDVFPIAIGTSLLAQFANIFSGPLDRDAAVAVIDGSATWADVVIVLNAMNELEKKGVIFAQTTARWTKPKLSEGLDAFVQAAKGLEAAIPAVTPMLADQTRLNTMAGMHSYAGGSALLPLLKAYNDYRLEVTRAMDLAKLSDPQRAVLLAVAPYDEFALRAEDAKKKLDRTGGYSVAELAPDLTGVYDYAADESAGYLSDGALRLRVGKAVDEAPATILNIYKNTYQQWWVGTAPKPRPPDDEILKAGNELYKKVFGTEKVKSVRGKYLSSLTGVEGIVRHLVVNPEVDLFDPATVGVPEFKATFDFRLAAERVGAGLPIDGLVEDYNKSADAQRASYTKALDSQYPKGFEATLKEVYDKAVGYYQKANPTGDSFFEKSGSFVTAMYPAADIEKGRRAAPRSKCKDYEFMVEVCGGGGGGGGATIHPLPGDHKPGEWIRKHVPKLEIVKGPRDLINPIRKALRAAYIGKVVETMDAATRRTPPG